jgi:hypothetical protein
VDRDIKSDEGRSAATDPTGSSMTHIADTQDGPRLIAENQGLTALNLGKQFKKRLRGCQRSISASSSRSAPSSVT